MKTRLFLMSLFLNVTFSASSQYRSVIWEKFLYSGPGLKQTGWLKTKHSEEITASPWSVGCETLDRDYAKFSLYKDYVGELGVKKGRLQSGWAKCEKEPGKYNFLWLDSCIYGLNEMGIEPWVCLCYGNPIYGSEIKLGAKIFTDEKSKTAWCKYVEATVTRYKDVVREWEVWNEPNTGDTGYEEYAALLIRTAETIKNVQPDAKVIGFSLGCIPLKFTEEVFKILKANNKLDLVDYLTYHPYDDYNPDDCYPAVEKLEAIKNNYNPRIRLIQGENGCPSILEWTHAFAGYPWTEISQAKWIMRRMAGDALRSIPSSVFTIIDLQYWNMLQSFGLLRSNILHQVIYKKPSYYGVQHMVNVFDDSVKSSGELQYFSNGFRKLTVAGFKKNELPVVLLWYKDRIPDDEIKWDPIDLTIHDVNFSDPVYVEMITGKVFEIDKSNWSNDGQNVKIKFLPVWDSVMMIAERSALDIKSGRE